jgi:hypothetical protein
MPLPSPVALLPAAALTHTTRSVRRGDVVAVARGVYAEAADWGALSRWDRDLARVHAHLLTHPDAVVFRESAALLWGLPIVGALDAVHVLARAGSTSRRVGGARVHTSAHDDRAIEDVGGIRLASVADTCVDVARQRHPAVALAVADAAVRGDARLSAAILAAVNEERASGRGRRRARWALGRADARAESALESVSRAAIEWWGFSAPELQRWIGSSGDADRTDMWWPRARVAGEADGHLKYDGRLGDPVGALRAREERDRRLRRRGARAVAHWSWDDLAEPSALRDILFGVGLIPEALPDLDSLSSLSRLLRPARNPRDSIGRTTPLRSARELSAR